MAKKTNLPWIATSQPTKKYEEPESGHTFPQ